MNMTLLLEATIHISLTDPVSVLSVSDSIEDLIGFKPADLSSGKVSLQSLIHPDDQDIADKLFSTDMTELYDTFNIRLRQANGHIRCIKGEYTKVSDTFDGIILELLLQDSKGLYKQVEHGNLMTNFNAIMENTDDYIYFKDRNHVFTGASETLVELTNPSEHWTDLIGHTDYDVFPEEYADLYYKLEKQIFSGIHVAHEIQETLDNKGNQGWVDNRKYPIYDVSDDLIGLFGIARIITEQKQAETTLKESELRLKESQAYAKIGHWELLADEKTAFWSEQMYVLFGLAVNVKPGPESLCEVVNENDFSAFIESVKKSFSTGKEHHVEYRIKRPNDGEERWIECRGKVVVGENGDPEKISGFIQDITDRKKAEKQISESEVRFQKLLQNIPTISVQGYKLDGTTTYWNKASEALYGYTKEQAIGRNLLDLIIPEDMEDNVRDGIRLMAEKGLPSPSSELLLKHRNGSRVPVYSSHAIVSIEGRDDELFCMDIDLTEQKQAEAKLRLSARVFSDTHDGIAITDANKLIIDVNPAFCDITGYSPEEVIGQNPSILSSGKQSSEFYKEMWQTIHEHDHWHGEIWNSKKSGQVYAELLTISALKDEHDKVVNYVGIFSDITKSKEHQEELNVMAHYDVLTGLPNRVLFIDRFQQAIAHSKRTSHQLAICFLDLDNFKPINDNYGHNAGDQILIQVAQRIKDTIREEDTVSRQGGDEFALLLGNIDSFSQCEQLLERILDILSQAFVINDDAHHISASIGFTLYPFDDSDLDTLLRHADQAMYEAKIAGKNQHRQFSVQQDQLAFAKNHRLDQIQNALTNNEFSLYYQPKVNMVTGKVFGAEALIRWHHPDKGLIPPLDFLPIIDGTKLELLIGDWVINNAVTQLDTWQQQGISLEVSINISSHHLLSVNFFSQLHNALAEHPEVDPASLQLEILESSALGDLDAIGEIIKICQETLGVNFALDDFGTGYSSLTHLRNLPINTIKIDQTFVRDMLDDPGDTTIIDGVIGLADSFHRKVIAEGVETTAHGQMLIIMGCEAAQGYGIAKPMPVEDMTNWLSHYLPNQDWLRNGSQHLSPKEEQVALFKLICEQWQHKFISKIQSEPEEATSWPMVEVEHCPCNAWIERARHNQLFDKSCINKLRQALGKSHYAAQSAQLKYQEGHLDAARDELEKIQASFEDVRHALEQCK